MIIPNKFHSIKQRWSIV